MSGRSCAAEGSSIGRGYRENTIYLSFSLRYRRRLSRRRNTATQITVFAEGTNGPTEIKVYGSLSNSAVNGGSEGGSESKLRFCRPGLTVSANGSTSAVCRWQTRPPRASSRSFMKSQARRTSGPLIISGSASTSASGPDATAEAYIEYAAGDLFTCSSTIVGRAARSPPREAWMP